MGVLDSGRLSYGPVSRQFEKRFAEVHDSDYAVLSNSGTSSLVVALQAMKELCKWKDGDEVIVPATTFVATVNAVLHNRLTPVLVDVHPRYYDIDANLIERAITKRTRCIMPVSLFGYPCDLIDIIHTANKHGLLTLHDSCETMFASVEAFSVGRWADITCFSMYMAHTLVAGVGGIATCHSSEFAQKMRSLVNHGISLANLPTGEEYDPTFLARNFNFDSIGHSFRITELEAAIALDQLLDWRQIRDKRNMVALWIESALAPFHDDIQLASERERASPCQMVYPLVLKRKEKYNFMRHLRERGIECRDLLPLITQPCYAGMWRVDDYPVSLNLIEKGLYIGCHQDISYENVEYMARVVGQYFGRR